MPKITANDITMNYETQGTGDPLLLILAFLALALGEPRFGFEPLNHASGAPPKR